MKAKNQHNLYINVGNTTTTFAYTQSNQMEDLKFFYFKTKTFKQSKFVGWKIRQVIKSFNIKVKQIYLSSVVQQVAKSFEKYCFKNKINLFKLNHNNQQFIDLSKVNNPNELGNDLIAQSIYVSSIYSEAVVISLGTTTAIFYMKNNIFNGCIIIPGINESIKTLINNTDIKNIKLKNIDAQLGFDTNESISLGIIGSINNVVNNIKNSFKTKECPIIYSGGASAYITNNLWIQIKNLEILGLFVWSQNNNY